MADEFAIVANGLTYVTTNISFSNELFDNSNNSKEFLYDDLKIDDGTYVYFKFNAHNQFQMAKKFNEFADGNGFYKTIVPVKHLEENSQDVFYISRSQAKRLTAGFEKFKSVILDFNDVKEIGQAFADEVFRVYQNAHQTTKISFINANKNVKKMIERVKNNSIEKN